jgi:YVTN family beta-propeller protein
MPEAHKRKISDRSIAQNRGSKMSFNGGVKRIHAKWPILLAFLIVPAIVFAQESKETKAPPPPKKSSAAKKPAKKPTPPPKNSSAQKENPPKPDAQSAQSGQHESQYPNRTPPSQQIQTHNGAATVVRGGNGQAGFIRTSNVTISRTPYGRRVITTQPGGARIVGVGNSNGFVERPLSRPGFVQRTYVVGGRSYVRVYQNFNYRGVVYQRYVPGFYFGPRFYFWAGNPWAAPVYWRWGWGSPWWFFGGYFAPAPYYSSSSQWLTDYAIAADLQEAGDSQQSADSDTTPTTPPQDSDQPDANAYNNAAVSPAMRQSIAGEVQRQLDAEKLAASNPQQPSAFASDQAPPALSADQRVFIVSTPLQVYDGTQPCSLSDGDIVSRLEDTPDNDNTVAVSVLTSKASDCRSGAKVRMRVTTLQDFVNDLQARTDEGLKILSEKQGTSGLPPAPDTTPVPNPNGKGTPDPDAANQLKLQQQDADQTEKEVSSSAPPSEEILPEKSSPPPNTPDVPPVTVENWTKPQPGWLYVLDPRPNVGETGGHIWLVDPESGDVMGAIHTGYHPDFALSPDGAMLYIASDPRMNATELAALDTSTGEVFAGEKIAGRPVPTLIPPFSTMAVSGDGKFLRILVKTPDTENYQLDTISADSGTILPGIVHLGNCGNGEFVSFPTNDQIYFLCPNVKKIHIARTDDRSRQLDNIYGQWPWERRFGIGAAFPTAGGQSIAVVRGDGAIFQMDAVTLNFYPTQARGGPQEQITLSAWPRSPDGTKVYIGNSRDLNAANAIAREIRVYDTTTWRKLGTIKTSLPFWSTVTSPDGKYLYALAPEQHSILVIDAATMRELRTINVGAMPALALVAP